MDQQTRKVIFLVTEDWYFWSHRLPMAQAAREAGFEVSVATRVGDRANSIRAAGFRLHELRWTRGSLSMFDNLRAIWDVARIFRREKPDIVHLVALKPVIIGNVAAVLSRIPRIVNALTGLGHLFTSNGSKVIAVRIVLHPLLKVLLARRSSVILLQNPDDRARLQKLGYSNPNTVIIRGSGVDVDYYTPLPPADSNPITIAFVGRLIAIKGVRTLIEAHRRLRERGLRTRLLLVGEPDRENPAAISAGEIAEWADDPDVQYLGHCTDIRSIWSRADIAVLPSLGGEGLPKSLLEAAACGRPLIATDVPGSREIAIQGYNALLVPPGDADALCNAMEQLASDQALREAFGAASRRLVESDMSQKQVARATVDLYQSMLNDDYLRSESVSR